jgi:hypothetical protein
MRDRRRSAGRAFRVALQTIAASLLADPVPGGATKIFISARRLLARKIHGL